VEAAAANAIANAYRITAGTPTPNASKYSEAYRRSVTYTFLEASRSSGGKQKAISPGAEEMANYRRTIADGFPHWSKLQHRAP
jgi:hypothetical protein